MDSVKSHDTKADPKRFTFFYLLSFRIEDAK